MYTCIFVFKGVNRKPTLTVNASAKLLASSRVSAARIVLTPAGNESGGASSKHNPAPIGGGNNSAAAMTPPGHQADNGGTEDAEPSYDESYEYSTPLQNAHLNSLTASEV